MSAEDEGVPEGSSAVSAGGAVGGSLGALSVTCPTHSNVNAAMVLPQCCLACETLNNAVSRLHYM